MGANLGHREDYDLSLIGFDDAELEALLAGDVDPETASREGEVLESYVTKRRYRRAALKFIRKSMKRHGRPHVLVTDKLRSYGAAMKDIGNVDKQETGRRLNNPAENSHLPFRR